MFNADLAVVGAGPAGLAAAIGARLRGFSVIVVDARHPPIDKACGEGLLPEAMEAARRLGLELPFDAGAPIEGIRFQRGARVVESAFEGVPGRGFRRTALNSAMVRQAEQLGVQLRWGASVSGVSDQTILTSSGPVTARWIAGADGERSAVRRWAGLDGAATTTRYAFRQHYQREPWTTMVEVHWGDRCQAYVTPLGGGQVGVAVISHDQRMRVGSLMQAFPALRQRLERAVPISAERGAVTTSRRLPQVVRGPIALVGDASGTVDAITGDGIGLAFLQAELFVGAIQSGDLSLYQLGHRALGRRARWMGRALLLFDRNRYFAELAIRAFSARPSWFHRLVALHVAAP